MEWSHRNKAIVTFLALATSSVISFVSVPILVSYFGTEQYGLFSLVGDTLAYLALANLGVPNAIVTTFANIYSIDARKQLVKNGLVVSIVVATILCLLLFVVIIKPGFIFIILGKVPENIAQVVTNFFIISVFFFIIQFPLSMYGQLLVYTGHIHIVKIINIGTSVFTLPILFIVIFFRLSLVNFVFINGLVGFVGALIVAFVFYRILLKEDNDINDSSLEQEQIKIKKILSNSYFYFINAIAGLLIMNTDNLIISHNLGLAEVAQYSVANKIILLIISMMVQYLTIFVADFPKYKEDPQKVSFIIKQLSYKFCVASSIIAIAISLFLVSIIKIWTHNNIIISSNLALCFSFYILCVGISQVPYYFLYSLDMIRSFYKFAIFEGIINLVLSLILVKFYGLVGVIFATFIAHFFCSCLIFNILCYIKFPDIFPTKLMLKAIVNFLLSVIVVVIIAYFKR